MKKRSPTVCPIVFSLDIYGDKWSLLILRDMIILNKRYYRQFLASREKIATNILANRLESLIEAGLITKKTDPQNKSQVIYSPTKKALELLPIMFDIMHWGLKYNPNTDMSIPIMQQLKADEKTLKKKLLSQFPDA